ncbi:MAG: hypothetical protein ACI3XR_01000 [Eubacteriales bacterium]
MTNKICRKAKRTLNKMNDMQDFRGETGISARLADAKGHTLCAMHNTYSFRIPMVALLLTLLTANMVLMTICLCHRRRHRRQRQSRRGHGDAVFC